MKRFMAMIMVFSLIFSFPIYIKASDYEVINIHVVSDTYGYERIEVLGVDDSVYMSIDDLSRFSGYEKHLDDTKYTFGNGLFTRSFDSKISFNNTDWLPLETTLGNLGIVCELDNKTLHISNNNVKTMYDLCQNVFEADGRRKCSIDYLDNGWGKAGLAYTYFWEFVSGKFTDVVDRERKYTKTCLASLVVYDEDELEVFDAIIELYSARRSIYDTNEWLEIIFQDYDGSDILKKPDGAGGFIIDNVDSIYSELSYVYSLQYASELYLTGIKSTIPKYNTRSSLKNAAKEIINVCESERDAIDQFFYNSLVEMLKGGVDNWVEDQLGFSSLTGLSVSMFVNIMNRYANTDVIMSAIGHSDYYREIQQSMVDIYYAAKNKNDYVGMKYATLLYLRCYEKAYKTYEFDDDLKGAVEHAIKMSREYAIPIAAISDESLIIEVDNSEMKADDLKSNENWNNDEVDQNGLTDFQRNVIKDSIEVFLYQNEYRIHENALAPIVASDLSDSDAAILFWYFLCSDSNKVNAELQSIFPFIEKTEDSYWFNYSGSKQIISDLYGIVLNDNIISEITDYRQDMVRANIGDPGSWITITISEYQTSSDKLTIRFSYESIDYSDMSLITKGELVAKYVNNKESFIGYTLKSIEKYVSSTAFTMAQFESQILNYYNNLDVDDGTYVIFSSETTEDSQYYYFLIRYQITDKEAEDILARGGMPAANIFADYLCAEKETGIVTSESGCEILHLIK